MDGLLVVRDPGVVRTTRILPNSNEATSFIAAHPLEKVRNSNFSSPLKKPLDSHLWC